MNIDPTQLLNTLARIRMVSKPFFQNWELKGLLKFGGDLHYMQARREGAHRREKIAFRLDEIFEINNFKLVNFSFCYSKKPRKHN